MPSKKSLKRKKTQDVSPFSIYNPKTKMKSKTQTNPCRTMKFLKIII